MWGSRANVNRNQDEERLSYFKKVVLRRIVCRVRTKQRTCGCTPDNTDKLRGGGFRDKSNVRLFRKFISTPYYQCCTMCLPISTNAGKLGLIWRSWSNKLIGRKVCP